MTSDSATYAYMVACAPTYSGIGGVSKLPGAKRDVARVVDAVRSKFKARIPHGVVTITSSDTDALSFQKTLLCEVQRAVCFKNTMSKSKPCSVMFVLFFAGHGARTHNTDAAEINEEGVDEGFLFPAALSHSHCPSIWKDDNISTIVKTLVRGGVHFVGVFDACYGGGFVGDVALHMNPYAHRNLFHVDNTCEKSSVCVYRNTEKLRKVRHNVLEVATDQLYVHVLASALESNVALEDPDGTQFSVLVADAIKHGWSVEQACCQAALVGGSWYYAQLSI